MMRKKIILFAFLMIAGTVALSAQKSAAAKAEFVETVHDFGNIAEADGDVTCRFVFKNTGKSPLIVVRAVASCGCTEPEHPKVPVAPGKTGEIKVTYHPKGRPGEFNKNVYVYTNGKPEKYTLLIKGVVIPGAKK